MGLFHAFLDDPDVALYGVEAGGRRGGDGPARGAPHGGASRSAPWQPHLPHADGLRRADHAGALDISAGLDYPGVGPEHAWLKDTGRATYVTVNDDEALGAFHECTRTEGIIPALESSHALAYGAKLAAGMRPGDIVVVNLSGRGDKDIQTVAAIDGIRL